MLSSSSTGLALKLSLALTAALAFNCSQAADSLVLHYDDQAYQQQTLPSGVQTSLHSLEQQLNQQRLEVLNNYAVNRYVREQAEQQGKPFQQLQQALLGAPTPTRLQIETFYTANQTQIQGTLPQVQDKIGEYLQQQAMIEKQRALLEQIALEKGYRVELPALPILRLPIELTDYPSKGNPDARVTLVEFADYQCPHCKDAGPVVEKILEQYGEQVRLVFRDFPINRSGISRKIAEAAVCADQQEQYWPFHKLAFSRQAYLKSVTAEMLATELPIDIEAFNSCLQTGEAQARVAASEAEARELGVSSTPTFFVNGRPLPNSHSDLGADIRALIDQELQAAK
ncbi:MAG: protein-disulfide isomerase [Motiliproteus sp.]|jgi:protein-disulfide isomerase